MRFRSTAIATSSFWTTLAVILMLGPTSGCASLLKGPASDIAGAAAKGVVEQATRPAILEILTTLNEPEIQALIGKLMRMPDLAQATRDMGAALIGGSLDAVTEPERQARLRAASAQFVRTMTAAIARAAEYELGPALARTLSRDFAPAMATMMADTTATVLLRVLSEDIVGRADTAAASISNSVVLGLARGLEERLIPMLKHELGGSEAALLATVGDAARVTAKNFVLGLDEGFIQISAEVEAGTRVSTLLSRVNTAADAGLPTILLLGVVAGAMAVAGLLLWVILLTRRMRRERDQVVERDTAIRLLVGVIDASHNETWGPSLEAALEKSLLSEPETAAKGVRKLLHPLRSKHANPAEPPPK